MTKSQKSKIKQIFGLETLEFGTRNYKLQTTNAEN